MPPKGYRPITDYAWDEEVLTALLAAVNAFMAELPTYGPYVVAETPGVN